MDLPQRTRMRPKADVRGSSWDDTPASSVTPQNNPFKEKEQLIKKMVPYTKTTTVKSSDVSDKPMVGSQPRLPSDKFDSSKPVGDTPVKNIQTKVEPNKTPDSPRGVIDTTPKKPVSSSVKTSPAKDDEPPAYMKANAAKLRQDTDKRQSDLANASRAVKGEPADTGTKIATRPETPKPTNVSNLKSKIQDRVVPNAPTPRPKPTLPAKPAKKGLSDFEKAFASARKKLGSKGTFTWKGKKFNTKYKEEVNEENLQELSKDTLKSYASKAIDQLPGVMKKAREWSGKITGRQSQDPRFKAYQRRIDHNRKKAKVKSRLTGIDKALNKLTKEENLQELSVDTLKSYKDKAAKTFFKNPPKKDVKRMSGMMHANAKIRAKTSKTKPYQIPEETVDEGVVGAIKKYIKRGFRTPVQSARSGVGTARTAMTINALRAEKNYKKTGQKVTKDSYHGRLLSKNARAYNHYAKFVNKHSDKKVPEGKISFNEANELIASRGFLEVFRAPKEYVLSYGGNMGASVADVEVLANKLFNKPGAFAKMLKAGVANGSPDYQWTLKVPKQKFESLVNVKILHGKKQLNWDKFNKALGTHIKEEPSVSLIDKVRAMIGGEIPRNMSRNNWKITKQTARQKFNTNLKRAYANNAPLDPLTFQKQLTLAQSRGLTESIAKKIMPKGHKSNDDHHTWHKEGGYVGHKMIDKAVEKAKKLGFKEKKHDPHSSPDGSVMGSGTEYHHKDGHVLSVGHSYGATKSDNHFRISLKVGKGNNLKEESKPYKVHLKHMETKENEVVDVHATNETQATNLAFAKLGDKAKYYRHKKTVAKVMLSELSKKALGSYIKKASDDMMAQSKKWVVGGTPEEKKKAYAKINRKIKNRDKGLDRALDRTHPNNRWYVGEEENLQELSKKTLKNYIHKANNDREAKGDHAEKLYKDMGKANERMDWKKSDRLGTEFDKSINTMTKRRKGITKAYKKLAKEENLQELSKAALKSYTSKASKDLKSKGVDIGKDKWSYTWGDEPREKDSVHLDKKTFKRLSSVLKTQKLAKEETFDEGNSMTGWHGPAKSKNPKSKTGHQWYIGHVDNGPHQSYPVKVRAKSTEHAHAKISKKIKGRKAEYIDHSTIALARDEDLSEAKKKTSAWDRLTKSYQRTTGKSLADSDKKIADAKKNLKDLGKQYDKIVTKEMFIGMTPTWHQKSKKVKSNQEKEKSLEIKYSKKQLKNIDKKMWKNLRKKVQSEMKLDLMTPSKNIEDRRNPVVDNARKFKKQIKDREIDLEIGHDALKMGASNLPDTQTPPSKY